MALDNSRAEAFGIIRNREAKKAMKGNVRNFI